MRRRPILTTLAGRSKGRDLEETIAAGDHCGANLGIEEMRLAEMKSSRRACSLEDGGWDASPDHRFHPWRAHDLVNPERQYDHRGPAARYLAAIVIGLAVIALYPWLIGIWFVRRRKDKRDEEIQAEVQKQLAQERSNQNQG